MLRRKDDGKPNQPLYQRIASTLREDVAAGRPPVGDALAGEEDLARRFNSSRYTLRAALRVLENEGLILRRNGTRSVVVATQRPEVFTQTVVDLRQILNYPPGTKRSNLTARIIKADEGLTSLLRCSAGRRWFRIEAIRRSPQYAKPLCWTELYMLPRFAPLVDRSDHEQTPIYEQIERQFGEPIDRAQVEITSGMIPHHTAQELEVEAGAPALVVVRRYVGRDGQPLEITRSWHPMDRYMFSMELQRR